MNAPPQAPSRQIPADLRCAFDYERAAQRFIAAPTQAYIAGGSGHDRTVAANRAAFAAWTICPRLPRAADPLHTRASLPNADLAHPLLLAPVAYHTLVHAEGEVETARGAAAAPAALIASTQSSVSLERIAQAAGDDRWFQLYLQPDFDATLRLVRRAEQAGYRALVVTVDAAVQVPSFTTLASGFALPAHCVPANLVDEPPQDAMASSGRRIVDAFAAQVARDRDLDALLKATALPVWAKGVMHADDALALKARGVAGIVVSNHGGRALDGAPASLDRLAAIRAAVGDDYPLLFDGGIRSGDDVFKAIALGADAVLVGRLQLYALAVAGALGVAHMLRMLREELEVAMMQAGCGTLADVRGTVLVPRDRFPGETPAC